MDVITISWEVAFVALMAAWLLLLLIKTGAVEWLQVHGSRLIHELASCYFCLSWWLCVAVTLVLLVAKVISNQNVSFCEIIIPILSTPITRKLL